MGPKKGVISQSVKDVVQSLVDDDLVSKDKIGTSVSMLFLIHTSKCEISRYLNGARNFEISGLLLESS